MTRFWHRRICEAVMLVAAIVLALYFWAYFNPEVKNIGSALLVSGSAAIFAGVSLITAFVSYLWVPRERLFWTSLAAFGLLAVTTGILVLGTGGASSPFIALWMIVSVFSGVFGIYGLLPLFLALGAYLVSLSVSGLLAFATFRPPSCRGWPPATCPYLFLA
jgi:hypothetical protein